MIFTRTELQADLENLETWKNLAFITGALETVKTTKNNLENSFSDLKFALLTHYTQSCHHIETSQLICYC